MERTSDLHLLSHFVMRRTLYENHQIFCNFISSDLELNITVGKLWWENKERRKCRRKEDRDTLHFKLQIDFFCREGENRFGAEFPRKCQHVQSYTGLHGLSWNVYLGEQGFVSKERGAAGSPAWLLCVVRLPPSATVRGVGWPGMAAGLLRVLLCMTSVLLAPPGL